ncbi:Protein of unknown function [Pseudonocardia ammonioxydans]|uniref:DUF3987 domain-containing protein n=1 Tax=Pseudonocardia ammonioxydans TaxID=260086 RepID=A0A1I5IGC8_PSUAM|nr:YfjI family protein [Pseudonocardia ammonioxydans]SFO59111.1 Protein of unknown function [Pseudonocardia ammonioxydans]
MSRRRTASDILTGLDAEYRLALLHGDDELASEGWDVDPTPLTPRRLLPPFPVDALPPWVADMVLAVAEFTQTPLDLPGCLALAALSTAAGGRAEVEVRPGWREPCNLYTVVAMPPGSRKSAVFAAMTAPLLEAEQQLVDQARPRIVEAELARKVAVKEAERRTIDAANMRDPAARAEALAAAANAALDAEKPVLSLPRLIADDVTTEAAASLLAEQGGRLAVLSAEGGIFSTLAGRYSGGVPSLEVFLKGHAGDLLRVDRKGRPAEHVASPALTLELALQPEVLTDIAGMPGFRGRGLLARILYSVPENTVGRRQIGARPPRRRRVGRTRAACRGSFFCSPNNMNRCGYGCTATPTATSWIWSATSNLGLLRTRSWRTSRTGRRNSTEPSRASPGCCSSPRSCRPDGARPFLSGTSRRRPGWATTFSATPWPFLTRWALTRPSMTPASC